MKKTRSGKNLKIKCPKCKTEYIFYKGQTEKMCRCGELIKKE